MEIKVSDNLSGKERRKEITRQILCYAIEKFKGSKTKVAEFSGISYQSFRTIMNKDSEMKRLYRKQQLRKKIEGRSEIEIRQSMFYVLSCNEDKEIINEIVFEKYEEGKQ